MAQHDRLNLALADAEAAALRLFESLRLAKSLVPRVAAEAVVQDRLDATAARPTSPSPSAPPRRPPVAERRASPASPKASPSREPRKEFAVTLALSPKPVLGASQRLRPQPRPLEDGRRTDAAATVVFASATVPRGSPPRIPRAAQQPRASMRAASSPGPAAGGSPSRLSLAELALGGSRRGSHAGSVLPPATVIPVPGSPGSVGGSSAVTRLTGRDDVAPAPTSQALDADAQRTFVRAEETVSEALSLAATLSSRRANPQPSVQPLPPAARASAPIETAAPPPPPSQWLRTGERRDSAGALTTDSLASERGDTVQSTHGSHAGQIAERLASASLPVPRRTDEREGSMQVAAAFTGVTASALDAAIGGAAKHPGDGRDGDSERRSLLEDERGQAILRLLGALQSL